VALRLAACGLGVRFYDVPVSVHVGVGVLEG
jgi:hypothetical protein